MANNSKPEQRKRSSADGLNAGGEPDAENLKLDEDEIEDDGQGIRAADGADDEVDGTESTPQRASVHGEEGRGRQAASEGRGGRNARGR